MNQPKGNCVCGHPKSAHQYNTEIELNEWECLETMCVDGYKLQCQCHELRPDIASISTCDHSDTSDPAGFYGTSELPNETDWNFDFCPKCGEKL